MTGGRLGCLGTVADRVAGHVRLQLVVLGQLPSASTNQELPHGSSARALGRTRWGGKEEEGVGPKGPEEGDQSSLSDTARSCAEADIWGGSELTFHR